MPRYAEAPPRFPLGGPARARRRARAGSGGRPPASSGQRPVGADRSVSPGCGPVAFNWPPRQVRHAAVPFPGSTAGFGAPLFAVLGAATGHVPDGYGDAPFTVWAVWPRSICGLCASALSQVRRHESVGTLFVTLLERV